MEEQSDAAKHHLDDFETVSSSVQVQRETAAQESKLWRLPEVFQKELREVAARRSDPQLQEAALECDRINKRLQSGCASRSSVDLGLVGLALSGGGVRSATFNLGVVQALHENGVLPHIDYLSTVSGGGYIGCCLSTILAQPTPLKELPFQHQVGEMESAAFVHLRNFSNYLAPGGTRAVLRLPALALQGLLTNLVSLLWLLVLPAVLLGIVFVWLVDESPVPVSTPQPSPTAAAALTAAAKGLTVAADSLSAAATALTPAAPGPAGSSEEAPRLGVGSSQPPVSAPAGQTHHRPSQLNISAYLAWLGAFFLVLTGLLVIVLPSAYRLWSRNQSSWQLRYTQTQVTTGCFYVFLALIFLWLQPVALYYLLDFDPLAAYASLSGAGVLGVVATLATRATQRIPGLLDKLLQVGLALLVPLTLWLIFLLLATWTVCPPDWSTAILAITGPICQDGVYDRFYWEVAIAYGVLACLFFMYFWFAVDVNVSSLHTFYRDRLSRAYLFDPTRADGIDRAHRDRVCLHDLRRHKHMPYHLINAVVNVEAAKTRNMRGRNADAFLFSPLFTGSELTGYCETQHLEDADDHVDVATAMAISGAAAAPVMGINTNRALRALLALANVRLGYWMRNPQHIPNDIVRRRPQDRPKQYRVTQKYFFYELCGLLHEKMDHVYITDGGHFDNLGVYELLRRRCRYIIIGDAEADATMAFNGLAHLMRIVRIDLGINITIDLSDLRKQPPGTVRSHCTIGKIDYGHGEIGELLYIKASVTGNENAYITEYRSRHPDFPHETTADQFFDEAQFEAYRALGHHIVSGLFVPRHSRAQIEGHTSGDENEPQCVVTSTDFRQWFQALAHWLQPLPPDRDTFVALQGQIANIERRLAAPEFADYSAEIFPEVRKPTTALATSPNQLLPEMPHHVLHLVNEQLQLMERAVLQLGLDDPRRRLREPYRGFMNLFRRWSQADAFRQAWSVSIANYSVNLQRFCEEALELEHCMQWRDCRSEADLRPFYEKSERDRQRALTSEAHLEQEIEKYVLDPANARPPSLAQLVNEFEWEHILRHLWHLADPACWHAVPKAPCLLVVELGITPVTGVPTDASAAIRFVAGFAIVQYAETVPVLTYLRVRDTYRGLRLSSRLAAALQKMLQEPYPHVVPRFAIADDAAPARRLRFTLQRLGFEEVSSTYCVPCHPVA